MTKPKPDPSILKRLRSWTQQNPLYRYRADNQATMAELANVLNVSIATYQLWESGNRQPNQNRWPLISRLLETDAAAAWRTWYKQKPSL